MLNIVSQQKEKNRNRLETQSSKFLFKNMNMLTILGDNR